MKWSENDELFKKELEEGFKWQNEVADYLNSQGLIATVPKLTFRNDISEIEKYADLEDIECLGRNLEVKSRKLKFTCPQDFPYPTILVDTVSGFESKVRKPDVYICISTITRKMICLSTSSTKDKWLEVKKFDATRGITDIFYECPKSEWKNISVLVGKLKKIKN